MNETPTPNPDKKPLPARVTIQAQVPPGMRVRVHIEAETLAGEPLGEETQVFDAPADAAPRYRLNLPAWQFDLGGRWEKLRARLSRLPAIELPALLFGLAIFVYLLTRLIGLVDWPIYFFTDEAVQTVLASDLVRDGFLSPQKELLPTYFLNVYQYNLSTSVYLQVIPLLIFGKSVAVTRATAMLMTLIAAFSVGLTLKNIFQSRFAWIAVLLLSITPAWFLHSRTAFETTLAVSFYSAFLYCYLRYRSGSLSYLFGAVAMAALTFYSYSPGQMVIAVSALLLFLTDIRYHWEQRKTILFGFLLALVLAIPYIRWQVMHPNESLNHLIRLGSYWVGDAPLSEKLGIFFNQYTSGLDPFYWYLPNNRDLSRHLMLGYGHLFRPLLPVGLLGVAYALRYIRQAKYRVLIIALIAAPSGAALVGMGITRALFMVIPAVLLSAVVVSAFLEWLLERWKVSFAIPSLILAAILISANFLMLGDALTNGPVWYKDYGLGGLQYGARQVFGEIKTLLAEDPRARIVLSSTWANGTDVVARFFFPDPIPFQMGSIEAYLNNYKPIEEDTLFILTDDEYLKAVNSAKFTDIRVERTLPYPDGRDGFYFTRMRYVDNIEAIFAAEAEARRIPEEADLLVDGSQVHLLYSRLDMGTINNLFDGDLRSLIRSLEANPLRVTITFQQPRPLSGLDLHIGGGATTLDILVIPVGETSPHPFNLVIDEHPDLRTVTIDFGEQLEVQQLEIQVKNTYNTEPDHVHLWEVIFRE